MAKDRILIVADEQRSRDALRTILAPEGYELAEAKDGEEALARLREFDPQVVLAQVRLPCMDGLTLLQRAKEEGIRAVFLMMTPSASVETAVQAMRAGAENYLVEPLEPASVLVFVEKALEKARLISDARNLRERFRFEGIADGAPELQAILEVLQRAANSKSTVPLERAAVLGKSPDLRKDDLPATLREPRPTTPESWSVTPGASLHEIEHEAIVRTLEMVSGSTTRTAEILGISVRKIQYRLKEYGTEARHPTQAARPPPPTGSGGGHES